MTIRIAQFVHATHDVVDEAFLREFPEVEAIKANNLESLADALEGAEIFQVYNSAFTPEFAKLVRDKGRALKWIQFTTVGIDIALKAGLPEGVWITNSTSLQCLRTFGSARKPRCAVCSIFPKVGAKSARRKKKISSKPASGRAAAGVPDAG